MFVLEIIDRANETFTSVEVKNIQSGQATALEMNNFNYSFLPFVRNEKAQYVANSETKTFIIRKV